MIKMTNGQCIWISNGPIMRPLIWVCNALQFFSPIKTKFIQVAACQNQLTPPHFSKWQLSAEVEEGARFCILCVCTGAIALFHVPLFLATSAHPFNWVNRWLDSFCLLQSGVHLPLFLLFFAFSTIMNVCCQFHDETLFITKLHFLKAKIAVDLKRFLYFKINFWVLQYSYSFGILYEWNITLCCSCS